MPFERPPSGRVDLRQVHPRLHARLTTRQDEDAHRRRLRRGTSLVPDPPPSAARVRARLQQPPAEHRQDDSGGPQPFSNHPRAFLAERRDPAPHG